MSKDCKPRTLSLDLIRALAIVLVITIHTFAFDVTHPVPLLRASVLCVAKMAVPLFLLLTGYLNNRKTVEDYYERGLWKGCFRVLLAYVVLGGVCYVYECVNHGFRGMADLVCELLSFQLTPYGWYVEMWIGLFFLTPFLNIVTNQLTVKRERALIVTLLMLTSVPLFFNRNNHTLLPGFWTYLWPVTLYFIGAYLSRHDVRVKLWMLITVVLGVALGEPILNLVLHSNKYLYFWGGQHYMVYPALAVVTFAYLKNAPLRWLQNNRICRGGNFAQQAFPFHVPRQCRLRPTVSHAFCFAVTD